MVAWSLGSLTKRLQSRHGAVVVISNLSVAAAAAAESALTSLVSRPLLSRGLGWGLSVVWVVGT